MLTAVGGVNRQDKHHNHQLILRIIEINHIRVRQGNDLLADGSAQLAVTIYLIIPAKQVPFNAPAFAVNAVAGMQK